MQSKLTGQTPHHRCPGYQTTHTSSHTPTHQPYVREFAGLSEYNTTSKVNDTHVPLSKFPPIFLL